jgi:rare lipoprotein A
MQTRRIGFWVYWAFAASIIAMIGSGVTADAKLSPNSETMATNAVAPVATVASRITVSEPASPVVAAKQATVAVTPLAESQPDATDLAATKVVDQVGLASWYDQGKVTASGERFDAGKLTAAHRTLPLDTKVKVTNLENGKSVEVKVNDRGPYIPGRVLDLSSEAAKVLGMEKQGLALVRIEVLPGQLADASVD